MPDTAQIGSERRTVALTDLRPHPPNYQKHPPDQEEIAALGWETVDVKVLDLDADSPLALRLVAGDNEISNLADVNDRALTELLREVAGDPLAGLLGSGFDALQLAALAMTTRPASELRDLAAAGEWLGFPSFEATPKEPVLTIKFLSVEDQARFLAEVLPGATITKRVNDALTTY
jgi:hypothetical protein